MQKNLMTFHADILLQKSVLIYTLTTSFPSLFWVKFSFFEKAAKIWKNHPLVLTQLNKNSRFVKAGGRFFSNFVAFS